MLLEMLTILKPFSTVKPFNVIGMQTAALLNGTVD
jgi:hypothetical protein